MSGAYYWFVWSVNGTSLLFWRLDLAYFREKKDLSFDDLASPIKKTAILQHGPQNKLTKLYNYGHKISKRFTQAGYSNTKAQTPSIKLAIFRDICYLLRFSSISLVLITVVSLANLHKRSEAFSRYYVTSHWQTEWVKKRRWKTIGSSSPPRPSKMSCNVVHHSLTSEWLILQIWSASAGYEN